MMEMVQLSRELCMKLLSCNNITIILGQIFVTIKQNLSADKGHKIIFKITFLLSDEWK